MNKKGFTLTELLIVLVLIVGVSTMSIIEVINLQNRTEQKELERIKESIEEATDIYINDNPELISDLLNGRKTSNCTRISDLQNKGLIDGKLINPKTNIEIDNNLCVTSTVVDGIIINQINLE